MNLVHRLTCNGECGAEVTVKVVHNGVHIIPEPPGQWIHLNQRNRRPNTNAMGDWFFCSWACVERWAHALAAAPPNTTAGETLARLRAEWGPEARERRRLKYEQENG